VKVETIETDRLTLVPLAVGHAEEMASVLSDPELHAFIGGAPATTEDLRARYERLVTGSTDPDVSWLNWVVRLRGTGQLAGTVQATVTGGRTDGAGQAEIAWVVGTPWQGRGIATEAARALVAWLEARGVGTVIAHVHPDHAASAAVAAAAGLSRTEVVHDGEVRWQRPTD
jgi:RimJ/RimL family protein N-acetyltransferase